MTNETMFEKAGRLFFTRDNIKDLEKKIGAAGISLPADSFAGYVAINIVVAAIFIAAVILLHKPTMAALDKMTISGFAIPFFIQIIMIMAFSIVAAYAAGRTLMSTYLLMKTDDRRNKLEAALPDFLSLVASNIKAGMPLDQAMWHSAKPEFGLLSTEVSQAVKGAFSGATLENSLDQLAARFDSKTFKRTVLLLKQASSTGGELTSILEKTADDVRNNQIMKKEISASLVLYEIFVLVTATIGAPFLFAVAGRIIGVFEKIAPQVSINNSQLSGVPVGGVVAIASKLKFAAPIVTSAEFFWFAIGLMFITAIVSSFIVGIIRTGTRSQGLKYFPFVLGTSYLVFWLVNMGIESVFAQIG